MTVDKLKRVMWRIRANNPKRLYVTHQELRRAIMIECGTCKQTYYTNKDALVVLGWIKTRKKRVYLTGKDLTEDFV